MKEEKQNKRNPLKSAIFAVLFFSFGFYFGLGQTPEVVKVRGLEGKEAPAEVSADFNNFWRVWNLIDEKYVPSNPEDDESASSQKRVWGAIRGMVASLGDPNTVFLLPKEHELFEEEINGNFEGVGMEVGIRDDILTVIAPLKNTPAYRAGIKSGDKIFKIGDKETANLTVDEAVFLIRGKRGTSVDLVLFREGQNEPIEITLIRDVIDIPTLDTEWNGDVFIIRLYNFSGNSQDVFRSALRQFIIQSYGQPEKKMILDLRSNPGGFLNSSIDITSWFLPVGKIVVKEDFGGKREDIIHRSRGYNVFGENLKMAILIDGGSASASEIVAGALSEHGVATLVGSRSFGKGSVQELVKIPPDTSLKVTVARWITPNGRSISVEGLVPDYEVETTDEDIKEGRDPVMEKALEILEK